ncbi:Bardet-Biedl syndrome 4 protein isoform X2 [Atheta coriaria]
MPEPHPMEKLNWLIHLYHIRGEIGPCRTLINDEIEQSQGKNEFALYKKGIILREEGNLQESLETFQQCHKINPENVDNLKQIGKCLFMLKRFRLALEAYLQAENAAQKHDWEIFHNIGESCLQLKDNNRAKEYLEKAVNLGKQEVSYNLLIKILSKENEWQTAVTTSNKGVESCPDSADMLTKSGILYLRIGETQHAFERLSSALALDASNHRALLGIGCITQNHEEHDVALSKYKIAVQTEPNSVALWNNIGMCFYAKQKFVAAVTCLKRSLWHSPLNWKVLINLGLVNLHTGQAASAFNFICAAVNIRPDLGHTFMLLGCALLELNDKENALQALSQALAMSPDDAYIVLNACLCYYQTGHRDKAAELLERFKNLANGVKTEELNKLYVKLDLSLTAINDADQPPPPPPTGIKSNENIINNPDDSAATEDTKESTNIADMV